MKFMLRNSRFEDVFIYVRTSLWFVPALFIIGAAVLALGVMEIDRHFDEQLRESWPRLFQIEAEGARSMLSSVATSMATVAGVVFSVTIVALTLASTQYSSRVLRTFMRDVSTQCVLGVLVGAYIYCLMVLRTISGSDGSFTPPLAVFLGFLISIVAVCFFIYFIHHISSTIQASEIIAEIARETSGSLQRILQEEQDESGGRPPSAELVTLSHQRKWHPVLSHKTGYIQTVQVDCMRIYAEQHDVLLRMECRIGEFIAKGEPLLSVFAARPATAEAAEQLYPLYAIGSSRTIEQDPAFGIRQLVDIAMKALSPSINDTTTAVTCIQYISTLMSECALKCKETSEFYDDQGQIRFIALYPSFAQLMDLSFNQILENGKNNTEVLVQLLRAIQRIARAEKSEQHRAILIEHARDVMETARDKPVSRSARERLARQFSQLAEELGIPE